MALIGALILLRPGPDSFQLTGLLALGAATLMGMELIFIKKLANHEPPFQILLINNATGLSIATLAVWSVWISILGALVILGGASLLAWRERRVRA